MVTQFTATCLKIGETLNGDNSRLASGLATHFLSQHICFTVNSCDAATNMCRCCLHGVLMLSASWKSTWLRTCQGILDTDQGQGSFTNCLIVTSTSATWLNLHYRLISLSIKKHFQARCRFTSLFRTHFRRLCPLQQFLEAPWFEHTNIRFNIIVIIAPILVHYVFLYRSSYVS